MHPRSIISFACGAALLAAAGCGGGVKSVEGTLTLDGTPVEGATITFYSIEGETKGNAVASAVSDAQGHFKVVPSSKEGIPSGKHKVVVIKTAVPGGQDFSAGKSPDAEKQAAAMKSAFELSRPDAKKGTGVLPPKLAGMGLSNSVLPEKYASVEKTPLEVTIPAPDNKVELKLTKG